MPLHQLRPCMQQKRWAHYYHMQLYAYGQNMLIILLHPTITDHLVLVRTKEPNKSEGRDYEIYNHIIS